MTVTMDSALTSAPYLTPSELVQHVDVRLVADLVSDTGSRVGSSTDTAAMLAALAANAVLLAKINAACGELESMALRGQVYTQANLAQIASSGTMAAVYMKQLLSHLTVCRLWQRRADKGPVPKIYESAIEEVKNLGTGQAIFGTLQHEQAGLPLGRPLTIGDPIQAHSIARRAKRYFGSDKWGRETFPGTGG